MKNTIFNKYFLVCKELSNYDAGGDKLGHRISGGTRPGAGFKTGDFVKEKLGALQ